MRLILLALLLAGCASPIKFQKKTSGDGYVVKELSSNRHFEILVFLPAEVSDKTKFDYAWLAGMEECLARGYDFSDAGEHETGRREVRCFPKNEIKALGIQFFNKGINESPRKFIVENTNKTSTLVKSNDVILSMAGEKITSMPQIKSLIFQKGEKEDFILLELIRDDRVIKVKEPLVLVKDWLDDKNKIANLRLKFR